MSYARAETEKKKSIPLSSSSIEILCAIVHTVYPFYHIDYKFVYIYHSLIFCVQILYKMHISLDHRIS